MGEAELAADRLDALVDLGRPQQAVELLRRAPATEPDDIRLWCGLARAHLNAGEPDWALGAVDRANHLTLAETYLREPTLALLAGVAAYLSGPAEAARGLAILGLLVVALAAGPLASALRARGRT